MRRRILGGYSGVRYVEYLESTGTQYIDTEYIPTENTKFVFRAAFLNGNDFCQYGAISTDNSGFFYNRMHGGVEKGELKIYTNHDGGNCLSIPYDAEFHRYSISRSICSLDDKASVMNVYLPTISLYLFYRNSDFQNTAKIESSKCEYCKIYEKDILVRCYLPCVCKGVPCMHEVVQDKFYYNKGTGEFLYG